ncbi:MAG: hypothetical protein F4176_00775 [Acidimicrobiia bacterium]|nr:hypothetical protein [Acidimicrobiia bacterium]
MSQQVFVNRGGVLPRPAPVVHAADSGPGTVIEGLTGWCGVGGAGQIRRRKHFDGEVILADELDVIDT